MSDFSTFQTELPTSKAYSSLKLTRLGEAGFDVVESYWGYSIFHVGRPQLTMIVVQLLVLLMGALCAASGMTLLLLSPVAEILFRSPLIFGCFAFSLILMWYATRGLSSHFEVDTHKSELRRVVLNRTGLLTIQERHGFDLIYNISIEPFGATKSRLCLGLRNGSGRIVIAKGRQCDLVDLSARLRRDMILGVVQRTP